MNNERYRIALAAVFLDTTTDDANCLAVRPKNWTFRPWP